MKLYTLVNHCAKVISSSGGHLIVLLEGEVMQVWKNNENGAVLSMFASSIIVNTPNSSVIESIVYSVQTSNLYVGFKNAKYYRYQGVPLEVVMHAVNAESVGSWFNAEVKNEYDYALL